MSERIVKPLEWRRPPQSVTLSRAETVIGTYRVWTHFEAEGRWFWELQGASVEKGDATNEVGAQSAAQADYEARILSALSPSLASLQEENEALKQRLSTAYRVKAECNDDANRERHLRVIVQEENEALKARIAELTAALKFYADAWCFTPNPKRAGLECKPKESLLDDCGNIARAALQGGQGNG